jgi:hypothetical protein
VSVTTLYRFYNTADELLYVGISEKGPERWKAHRKDKPWWTDVARTTTEHYDTRTEALDAERAAIIAEKPKHNVVHNRAVKVPIPRGQKTANGRRQAAGQWCFSDRWGHAWRSDLWLVYEVSGDPISSNYTPDERCSWELFMDWLDDYSGDLPIYWFIEGNTGVFESAPDAPNRHPDDEDFLDHFTVPFSKRTHTAMQFQLLRVADRSWENGGNKGGFINDVTGWKPHPYQATINTRDLTHMAMMRAEVT